MLSQSMVPSPEAARREADACMWMAGDALTALATWMPILRQPGDPVLVLPGLGTGDEAMAVFRELLRRSGYPTAGWGRGLNRGFFLKEEERLASGVQDLHARTGKRVAIVGWSLGGMYARAVAQDVPHAVSQVMTLGTPHLGLRYTTPAMQYEQRTGRSVDDCYSPEVASRLARVARGLAVPCTSIYSRTDGIAHWQACHMDPDLHSRCQSVEISGLHHFRMPYSVRVFEIVDELLRQDVDRWNIHPRAAGPSHERLPWDALSA